MFYSHTFLARKGPLGTVWCAAHLQHRLKKSQYTSTDIPSTVERIMYPEVPIALRISGHLLLGVVRIYAKKVEYLCEDCKVVSVLLNRVVITSKNVDLPDGATHAPFHSVTFPKRFELDAMELDDYCKHWGEDAHTKSLEDITLTEQVPTGKDPFIIITLEEDIRDSPHVEHNSGSGPTSMDEDVPPRGEPEPEADHNYASPNRRLGVDKGTTSYSTPRNSPSIEIMRDARNDFDFNNSPILPDRAEPDKFLEEQIIRDRETPTPIKEMSLPDGQFSTPQVHVERDSAGNFDSSMHFSHRSPELEIRVSPVVEQPPPVAAPPEIRKRKRKNQLQLYDQATVLSNKHMKKALDDTSDIRRKKRERPVSSIDIWQQNKRLKKDDAFLEPFITGLGTDLQDTHKEDMFISSKPHLFARDETNEDCSSPRVPLSDNNDEMDIEVLRNNDHASPERFIPFSAFVPSPSGKSYHTPENSNFGLRSERHDTTQADTVMPAADVDASNSTFDTEMRTPDSFRRMGFEFEHTTLSDIPELPTSPGELRFLDQDVNFPAGFQETPEINSSKGQETPELRTLSARTRAVAQYLKRQSLATPMLEKSNESSGDLSLSKILEGKSRKISARMFSEALVLKNFGLIDLNQDRAYDDITLKVTSKLSKVEFSG